MWRCPKCETVNTGGFCTVCGTPRPFDYTIREPEKKSNTALIVILIVLSVLITAGTLGTITFCSVTGGCNGGDEVISTAPPIEVATEEPGEEETEEPIEQPRIKEITDIDFYYDSYGDEVIIETTAEVYPKVKYLKNPDRIVLDFYGFEHVIGGKETGQSGYYVENIRYANHGTYARVVIDLYEEAYYTVDVHDDKCVVTIN